MMRKKLSLLFAAVVLAFTAGFAVACKDVDLHTGSDKQHAVTFYYNYDGAPNNGVYRTDKVTDNTAAKKPEDPTRTGYAFTEWTTDAAGTNPYLFMTLVKNDVKLYAQWDDGAVAALTEITATVAKTYAIGDAFNKSDITVTAKYDNGAEKTVTDFTYTPEPNMSTAGTTTLTVTYGGKTTTVDITVNEGEVPPDPTLLRVEITAEPTQTAYFVGDELDLTGLVVNAVYSDGDGEGVSKELDATDYTVTGYDKTKAETQTLTVSYKKKTATFTVTVSVPVVTKIEITAKPTKLTYIEGDELDLTGMVVTAFYSDNTSKAVTDYKVSGYDKDGIREQTVTVTFDEKKATFKVTVTAAPVTQYKMNFDANIAAKFVDKIVDMPSTKNVEQNTTTAQPDRPTLKGFTFDGWYKEATCTNAWNFATDKVTAEVTLYAKWTAKEYTVNYNLKSGDVNGTGNPVTFKATDADVTLAIATRDYHTSDGWYTTEKEGGAKVATLNYDLIPVGAATEIKLYARFTANKYNIDYELGGSSTTYTAALAATAPKQYTYGVTTTLPGVDDVTVTPAAGVEVPYVFLHWYLQGDATKAEVDTTAGMNGNKTFVALIEQKTTYKFTFDYGHDHLGTDVSTYSRNIVEGEKAIYRNLTEECDRPGYTFDGWYNESTFATEYDFNTPVTAAKTIYAKWTEIEYVIAYVGDGVTTTNPTTYKITNADVTLDTNPTLAEGYYFDGWYFDSSYGEAAVKLDGNIISYAATVGGVSTINVYAKSGNEYAVKYNTNRPTGVTESTSGKPDDTTVVYGNKITAPTTTPDLTEYAFNGWYTQATCDCEGTCTHAWDFDTLVNSTTATFDATHTFNLYARWYQKLSSGKYLVGGFNDWGDFVKRTDAADYKFEPTRTAFEDGVRVAKEWKISGVTLKADDTFKFVDYNKATNYIKWIDPFDSSACNVRPAAAMTITGGKNYEVTAYALGEGKTWTIEFGTNDKGNNYVTFTLDGYIDWRDPSDGSPENPSEDLELEDGVWYLSGNFTYWFNQSNSWSTKNAYKRNTYYMFTNVYLKKYDTFKIMNSAGTWLGGTFGEIGTPFQLDGNNAPDIKLDTIDDGYYNLVFNTADNTLTINKYVPVTIELKANNPIYVGDELKNDATTKAHFTVTANGEAVAAGNYIVLDGVAKEGENTVGFIYKGGIFEYAYEARAPQVVSITVEAAPTKKWYFVGDTLDTTGLKIKLTYDKSGMTETVTDASLFDVTAELVGVTTGELRLGNVVTVTVALKANAEKTAAFTVNVLNKVTSIEVTGNPTKMTYFAGDELDTTGLEVTVYFNGGTTLSTVTASTNYTLSPANGATLAASNNKITVSYRQPAPQGCTLTMPTFKADITGLVVNEPQITSVAITGSLDTNTYKVGDTFAAIGLAFTATYDNGDTASLNASDMTFTIASEYANGDNMFVKAGTGIAVTVKYGDITAIGVTVTVNVDNLLTSIKVDASGLEKPHAAGFVAGDELSVNGIVVTPVYNEGITDATRIEGDAVGNYTVTPALGAELTAGEKTITVRYQNKEATFKITVVPVTITGLTVTGTAAQQYMSGRFNASGLTFKALFNNDTDDVVPAANITFTCTTAMSGSGTFAVAGDHTMTATYEGQSCTFPINVANSSSYTVEFAINIPGSGKVADNMPDSTNVDHNALVTEPTAPPTLKGYTFGGWYKEAACTTAWDFANEQVTDNITIYAKWISKSYTIVYYVDGTAFGTPDTYTATANLYPNDYELKTTDKTGYTFKGWCRTSALNGTPIHHMTYARLPENEGDGAAPQIISLHAKFDVNSYNITFIANGDEVEDYAQSVEHNGAAAKPAAEPTRAHYTFAFWSEDERDAEDAAEFDFTAAITADVTLYAHWDAIDYTVDYKLNGGTNHADNPATYSITSASSITLKNPSKTGYKFIEWRYNNAKALALTHGMLPDSDDGVIELTAVFEQIVYYTVTFDLDYEVEGKITEVSVEKGKTVTKPANPSRTNWTFMGWLNAATDTEYVFEDAVNADIVLKAQWERQTVKVKFDFNYTGAPAAVETTVNKGESAVVPEDKIPVRDGWTIVGWYTDKDGTTPYAFGPTSADRTIYAKWQKLTGNYIVINDDEHELTDNTGSNPAYEFEYMIADLGVGEADKISFKVESNTVAISVNSASHGIRAVSGSTTQIEITATGTYTFYLQKSVGADNWTVYASYAEYFDYFYVVGEFTGNGAHKWATVNPEFRLSADNTITIDLEVDDVFKLAKAKDGAIDWNSTNLGYSNVIAADQSKVGSSGSNIKITTKGTYTISVDANDKIHISVEGVEDPIPGTLAVGKYLVLGSAQPSADYMFTTITPDTANNMTEQYTIKFEISQATTFKIWNQTSATSGSDLKINQIQLGGQDVYNKQTGTTAPTLSLEAGKYTIYYKVYTNWVRIDFIKETVVEEIEVSVPATAKKSVVTFADGSVTIYLKDTSGNWVTNLSGYNLYMWVDGGLKDTNYFGAWSGKALSTNPTVSNLTSAKVEGASFIINWSGGQTANLSGMEAGGTYVISLKDNSVTKIKVAS